MTQQSPEPLLHRRAIGSSGALLARPDGFVAWRTASAMEIGGLAVVLARALMSQPRASGRSP